MKRASGKSTQMTDGDKIAKAIDRLTDTLNACFIRKQASGDCSLVDAVENVAGAVVNLSIMGDER